MRTVGSYWPYAPTLFDYIRRAMPQNAPQSLRNEDVYAVSAYVLNLNGLLSADATLDAKTLAAIKMPTATSSSVIPGPTSRIPPARVAVEQLGLVDMPLWSLQAIRYLACPANHPSSRNE